MTKTAIAKEWSELAHVVESDDQVPKKAPACVSPGGWYLVRPPLRLVCSTLAEELTRWANNGAW